MAVRRWDWTWHRQTSSFSSRPSWPPFLAKKRTLTEREISAHKDQQQEGVSLKTGELVLLTTRELRERLKNFLFVSLIFFLRARELEGTWKPSSVGRTTGFAFLLCGAVAVGSLPLNARHLAGIFQPFRLVERHT